MSHNELEITVDICKLIEFFLFNAKTIVIFLLCSMWLHNFLIRQYVYSGF